MSRSGKRKPHVTLMKITSLSTSTAFLTSALFALLVLPAGMSLSQPLLIASDPLLAQQNSTTGTSVSTLDVEFPNQVSAGDTLVVALATNTPVVMVGDSLNSILKQYVTGNDGPSLDDYASVWAGIAPSNGSDVVVVTLPSAGLVSAWIYEFVGLSPQGINFNSGSGTSGVTNCGMGAIPTNGSVIISVVSASKEPLSSYSPGQGFISSGIQKYGGAE